MKFDVELGKRIEHVEAFAVRDGLAVAAKRFPEQQIAAMEISGAIACYCGPGSPMNQVFGLGSVAEFCERDLDAIVDFYESRNEPPCVLASPIAGKRATAMLAACGFAPTEFANMLALDLASVVASRDSRVAISSDAAGWAESSARSFVDGKPLTEADISVAMLFATNPKITKLEMSENGRIVATACLALEEQQLCGLFAGATLPEARGKGYHAALIADRIARAIEGGAKIAHAFAGVGSGSERNFRRAGFSVLYTRVTWMLGKTGYNTSGMDEKNKKQEPDEKDRAVIAADDTGLLQQEREINEDEILLGEDGKSLDDPASE